MSASAELRHIAVTAAQSVTELVLEGFAHRGSFEVKRDVHDIVTEFDRRTELILRQQLTSLAPGSGFVGEETGTEASASTVTWHVDPIDGTSNYASGMPLWSVSIGACVGEEMAAGVVWDPVRREMFSADETGTYLNDIPVRAAAPVESTQAELLTCYPDVADLDLDGSARAYRRHEVLQRSFRAVRGLGSSALQLAWVSAGRVAASIQTHQQSWDVTAGCFLVQQAGGDIIGIGADGAPTRRHPHLQPTIVAFGQPNAYPLITDLWQDDLPESE